MRTIKVLRAAAVCSFVVMAAGCGGRTESTVDTSQAAQSAASANPDATIMVRGAIVSASPSEVVIKTDTGTVTVAVTQPFHLYQRAPSDLSKVAENSFIGVTTIKQPDGSERATEIHVFPEELRGLGEGSRMMGPGAAAGRMTNGNVSTSRMTNGTASQSRMSNGNVSSTNGSSLVVQYAGGSQNVTVPPNTPVTELKLVSRAIAAGDQVAIVARKGADGKLTSDKAVSTAR